MTTEASFFGLTDKKATVIGGGQGMGESTSRFLARAGCDEAVIDIERERAERVAGAVGELGRRGVPIIGDVLDDTQIPTIVASVEQQLGGIDVMVSIVGAAVWDPCWTRPGDLGPAVASQPALFLPLRTGSGGNDDQARQSGRDRGHRLGGRTAIEPDARRVRCSEGGADQPRADDGSGVGTASHSGQCHSSGFIVTPRLYDTPERAEAYTNGLLPVRWRGVTDDIGKAALFLVSDRASYITGTTLDVDGGLLAATLFPRGFRRDNRAG